MKRLLVLFFAAIIFTDANAQTFNVHELNISWQAIENNYQNKDQSLNALVITNNGNQTLPASGWKLYFNSARDINTANSYRKRNHQPVKRRSVHHHPNFNFYRT